MNTLTLYPVAWKLAYRHPPQCEATRCHWSFRRIWTFSLTSHYRCLYVCSINLHLAVEVNLELDWLAAILSVCLTRELSGTFIYEVVPGKNMAGTLSSFCRWFANCNKSTRPVGVCRLSNSVIAGDSSRLSRSDTGIVSTGERAQPTVLRQIPVRSLCCSFLLCSVSPL